MNILIWGAAGFLGTNLVIRLSQNRNNHITLVDTCDEYFTTLKSLGFDNVTFSVANFNEATVFNALLSGKDIVYHLVSTTVPATSNQHIYDEFRQNVDTTVLFLDACVKQKVRQVVFFSSGGTVYGRESICPLNEESPTNPISSYGIQKLTIEKLLYLYNYLHGLDYRILRLSNPYGPYQRPNGMLGAITTFVFKALRDEEIIVYGDGSVVRDFIYIDDAIEAVLKVSEKTETHYKIYNIGSGCGTSINELLECIEKSLNKKLYIKYIPARSVDVPTNYLDICRYEEEFGKLGYYSLSEGIIKTADFLKEYYRIE